MIDATVLGDIVIDIVARLESYPPLGGDAQSLETVIGLGGTSLNTAVMLRRLGFEIALIGRVGTDAFGEMALERMIRCGLRAEWVERDPIAATALAYIAVTPDGQRTMLGGAGANRNLAGDGLSDTEVHAAQWLHLTSYNVLSPSSLAAAHRAMDLFAGRRAPISIDLGLAPVRLRPDDVKRLVSRASVIMPSDSPPIEASPLQTVVRKCGARGCEVAGPDTEYIAVPGFEVKVLDTTGAGDAFDAGFIAGRLRGLDERASGLLANACGAAACTVRGAGDALPDAVVVRDLLRDCAPRGWAEESLRARRALGL